MIDPITGEQIGDPAASRLSSVVAMDGMNQVGLGQDKVPLLFDLAASMPATSHTMMWNMGRVSNTITGGGKEGSSRIGRSVRSGLGRDVSGVNARAGGVFRRGIPQTFSPRYMRRLGHVQNIDPINNKTYSPFGALSRSGNWAARKAANYDMGRSLITKVGGSVDSEVSNFSRGSFGRMTAMAKTMSMSDAKLAGNFAEMSRNIHMMRPGYAAMKPLSGASPAMSRGMLAGGIGRTFDGAISGRVGGYFAGAQARRIGSEALTDGFRTAAQHNSTTFFSEGFEKALSSNKLLTKVVGSGAASIGMRAAGPIGLMLLARDIGTIGGKIVSHAGRTMIDAGTELMQPLNKGVMGATFRDNSVAATARARAMGAIGSSQMNAMSILGNEGAMMHARFG